MYDMQLREGIQEQVEAEAKARLIRKEVSDEIKITIAAMDLQVANLTGRELSVIDKDRIISLVERENGTPLFQLGAYEVRDSGLIDAATNKPMDYIRIMKMARKVIIGRYDKVYPFMTKVKADE